MDVEMLGTVKVEYAFRDGYHIFTSPELSGLYVANKDPEGAFRDVSPAIALLVRLNAGIECDVTLTPSLAEFLRHG